MGDAFLILSGVAVVAGVAGYVAYILGKDRHATGVRINALDLAINEDNRNGPAYLITERASAYAEFISPRPQEAPAPYTQRDGSINAEFREVS